MSKTNNPDRICQQCGAEVPINSSWSSCSCGALIHQKIKSTTGKLKKSICHIGEEANLLRKALFAKGVHVAQMTLEKD